MNNLVLIVSGRAFEDAVSALQNINDTKIRKIVIFTSERNVPYFNQMIPIYGGLLFSATHKFSQLTKDINRSIMEMVGQPE